MAALQAPLSLGFSRQEHWSGLPFPSPMHESEKWKWSRSVLSDSSRLQGLQPTRLLRPWEFPGKSTGVGCTVVLVNSLTSVCETWVENPVMLYWTSDIHNCETVSGYFKPLSLCLFGMAAIENKYVWLFSVLFSLQIKLKIPWHHKLVVLLTVYLC